MYIMLKPCQHVQVTALNCLLHESKAVDVSSKVRLVCSVELSLSSNLSGNARSHMRNSHSCNTQA